MGIVISLWLAASAAANVDPDYVTRTLTVADGLPVNATNAVRIGPQGYLWVATWDGLARYDGVHIERYRTDTHPELPSNRLIDLAVDVDGVLWLFAENQRIGRVREGRVSALDDDTARSLGAVLAHRLDHRGRLWLGTSRGVFMARDGALAPVCRVDESVRIQDLAPGPGGAAFLATADSGLLRCEDEGVEPVPPILEEPPAMASVLFLDGSIWVLDGQGMHRVEEGRRHTLGTWSDTGQSGLTWGRLEVVRGRPWARTEEGVFTLDDEAFRSFLPAADVSGWIPGFTRAGEEEGVWLVHGRSVYFDGERVAVIENKINGFEVAGDGTVWLATNGGGVVQLHRRIGRVFADMLPAAGRNLYAVAPSPTNGDRIWLGGVRSGLMMVEDGRVRQYPETRLKADDGSIWTILEDRDGRIWHGGTLLCRRLPDDSCDLSGLPPELVATEGPGREIRLLMKDRSGTIWIGAGAGLYRHDNGYTRRIEASPAATIRAGLERDDGSIWFGSNGAGLFLWRDGDLHEVSGISSGDELLIRSLYEDAGGVLWVGTEDQGLLRLELDDSRGDGAPVVIGQRQFGPQEGLWDNVIHYVGEDDRGRLWMNSNRGIFWIERERVDRYLPGSRERLPVVGYGEVDGLLSREGNGGAHNSGLLDDEGGLWLPGQAGLVHIDTTRVERDVRPPQVVIESARFGEDQRRVQPAGVQLPAGRRNLAVTYGAALFRHGERARFRYRLAGYDDWQEAGRRREAFYTNLPAGEYQFEVMAASADGVWSEQSAKMAVQAAARYYEQPWFPALIMLILAGLVVVGWRWRLAGIKAHAAQLEREVDERTKDLHREQEATSQALAEVAHQADRLRELDAAKSRFFTNLSHELRTPLTLIIGPAGQTLEQFPAMEPARITDKLRAIRDNGERLLDLVNQIQALSRLEAGYRPLKTAGGDLAALGRELVGRFTPMAAQRDMQLIGPAADSACVCEFDHDALDKILGNLLGNALRHSTGGRVTLSLRTVTGGVVASVADQGPGIPPERLDKLFDRFYTADHEGAGSGIGLALARELAHLHGGDLTVRSALGQGSVFKLVLPVEIERWQQGEAGEPEPVPDVTASGGAPALPDEERTTVLVVEDEAGVREFVIQCLAPDYRVLAAENGLAGLGTARRELPDVIVSDIMMPTMDGIELARHLAGEPATRALPVILLTARTTTQDELEGLASGAVDYLTKPFAPEILQARVRRMLGFARRLREQLRIERVDRARLAESEEDMPDLTARLERLVLTRLDDESLDVQHLAEALHMSRSRLKRAMSEAGLPPPATFVRNLRLREAAHLLERRRGNVSEVAYAVGFASLSHFTRRFREHFGTTPSEYANHHSG